MSTQPTSRASSPPRSRRPACAPRRLPWRRAVTFIETVCAVALLALISASMLSAVGYLYSSQHRNRQRLACAELSNRLLLQYLDDPSKMPAPDAPLEYGPERFRWDLREDPIVMHPAVADDPKAKLAPTGRLDRMLMVTVRVWLGEDSGGSRDPALGVPTVALWRFVDPLAFRNPDAINRMLSTDAGRRRLYEQILGGGSSGASGAPARNVPMPTKASGAARTGRSPAGGGS